MSKREEKTIESTGRMAEEATRVAQESINTSLDETKKNVRKSIEEARTQIPRYTEVVKNYQEQALESTDKIVEDYVEAQKSVINSVFASAIPYYENVQRMYNFWLSPKVPTE